MTWAWECFQNSQIILSGDTCGNHGLGYLRKRAQNEQVHGDMVLKDSGHSLILELKRLKLWWVIVTHFYGRDTVI